MQNEPTERCAHKRKEQEEFIRSPTRIEKRKDRGKAEGCGAQRYEHNDNETLVLVIGPVAKSTRRTLQFESSDKNEIDKIERVAGHCDAEIV